MKCKSCDEINICNTPQKFKNMMDGHFSDVQYLLKTGQKSDSFAAHYNKHFKSTRSNMNLCMCMTFKVSKQIKPTVSIKTLTKPNCSICTEEILTILKKLCDKRVMLMNKDLEVHGVLLNKTNFHWFFLRTDDPIIGWKG